MMSFAAAGAAALLGASLGAARPAASPGPADLAKLPANTWHVLDEVKGRGKRFARLICADRFDRLYLWGFGGTMPDRTRYERYELESFSPREGAWMDALPASRKAAWSGGRWPGFRIYGQGGVDGPRIRSVGSMRAHRVRFFETDGVARPSPVAIFNQACWDARRGQIVFFAGGRTFALDAASNTWTDLAPPRAPTACATLAWASLCYDGRRDTVLLFGGGLATDLAGGARTWLYDCATNAWRRGRRGPEPPLRCNGPVVYDAKTDTMVLFGGDDQAAARNDTWVYRCATGRWEPRRPNPSPPPMFAPAAAAVPGGGRVLVCGANALKHRRTHSRSRARKETWVYDVAADTWQPVADELDLPGYDWLTAAGSEGAGAVYLVACGGGSRAREVRRTYALRYDPSGPVAKRPGAPPGTVRYKYADQKDSLAAAPARTADAARTFFRELPANTVVDADPPGLLVSKTWSSATFDTHRGEVIYAGGGHSGYSGNDIAHYRPGENRWSLSWPPQFPPFLESTNASVFGFAYGARPWSQHTYRWYAYDPLSRRVIYCARPAGPYTGDELLLSDDANDAFVYDQKKHGYLCWTYDPASRRLAAPSLGRPFRQTWCLALVTTPRGVYARPGGNDRNLYHAAVRDGKVSWTVVDTACPPAKKGFHYEFQPLVYDSRRNRLLLLMGRKERVELYARDLASPGWKPLATTGPAEVSREVVYAAASDALVSLGEGKLHVLELASLRWRRLDVAMPKGRYRTECAMVHDAARDVCILLIPSRFSGPMKTYLFRLDPKTARYAP